MKSKNGNLIIGIILNIILTSIVVYGLLSGIKRVYYGTFDLFDYPNRVSVDGYMYCNEDNFKIEKVDHPVYELSSTLDKIFGNRIYSDEKGFKGKFGSYIYLNVKENRYIIYWCDGGG